MWKSVRGVERGNVGRGVGGVEKHWVRCVGVWGR